MADDLKRVVAWKNLLINGTDYCALWHTAEGWLLKGTVVPRVSKERNRDEHRFPDRKDHFGWVLVDG